MATPIATIQTGSTGAKPVATIGPKPQQLRAGTGSLWGDIKQDVANIFLPERFAAGIAKDQNPGSETYQDDEGNWILRRKDGTEFYLNEPGFSMQDMLNITGALALPGAGMNALSTFAPKAALALQGLGASNPFVTGMATGAGYSAAQQGVGAALTDQDISGTEIAQDAVFAGAIPGLQKYGGMALNHLADATNTPALRNPIRAALYDLKSILTPYGELTPEAKKALEAAGIKWQNFTPEQIFIANNKMPDVLGMNTQAQGRAAGMATLGIDNPTEGMLGQFPDVIAEEVKGLNRRGREASIHQLQDAGDQLGQFNNLESVGNRLVELHNTARGASDQAFDAARRAGEIAPVSVQSLGTLKKNMLATLEKDLSKDQVAAAMAAFPKPKPLETKNIMGPKGEVISSVDVPDPNAELETIRSLYEWRADHLSRTTGDPTGKARKAFDAEMQRWIEQGLASDLSADGIKAWQQAIQGERAFSTVWKAGDAVEKLIVKDKQGAALRIDPEAAANVLWNSSEVGFINKATLRKDLAKMKGLLGADSEQFQALADALAYKALKLRTGFDEAQRQGSIAVNGVDMRNHWARIKRESGDVLEEVYSPETLDAFDNFIEYARMMDTQLKDEAKIPLSQVQQLIYSLLKRAGSATFRFSRAAFQEAAERAKESGSNSALREFYGELYIPRGLGTPKIATGAATEVLWTELYDSVLRDWGLLDDGQEPLQIPILNGVSQ